MEQLSSSTTPFITKNSSQASREGRADQQDHHPLHPPSDLQSIERRRHVKREHIAKQVEEELRFLQPCRIVTQLALLSAFVALAAFIYTGFGNSAFTSVLFRQKRTDYGIVIDAGSHGTRLQFYSWPARIHDPDHPLSGPVTVPKPMFTLESSIGISEMALDDPNEAGVVCIKPLIVDLMKALTQKDIPKDKWPEFPIFLKATAGMRDMDIATRATIMNSIRRYLSDDAQVPFAFQWAWARVIAGEEEGVYGWLTVNNALSTVFSKAPNSFGAMDMGGASTQITFSPIHTSVIEGYYGVHLGGNTIRLYSHSFLGYGWDDAFMRLTTRLAVETILASPESKVNDHVKSRTDNRSSNSSSRSSPEQEETKKGRTQEEQKKFKAKGTQQSKAETNTTTITPASLQPGVVIRTLRAVHPCLPKGKQLSFPLPSLVYPDGRRYIDLDADDIIKYMRSIGIPDKYLKRFVPRKRSPPSMAVEASVRNQRSTRNRTSALNVLTNILRTMSDNLAHPDQDDHHSLDLETMHGPSWGLHSIESLDDSFIMPETKPKRPENEEKGKEEEDDVGIATDGLGVLTDARGEIQPSRADDDALVDVTTDFDRGAPKRRLLKSKRKLDRSSLFGSSSGKPFQPLDVPFTLDASPKVQWVIEFSGGSDFSGCQRRARDLFYDAPCFVHSCSFNGVYLPRLEESRFIAFGQFAKIQTALNLSRTSTPRQLAEATREICSQTKTEIRLAHNISGAYQPFTRKSVLKLCWKALWSHTMIEWGYGFHENTTNIEYAGTVGESPNDEPVGWATGSMIYEVNTLPWKSPIGKFEYPFLCATLTAVLFLLATVFMAIELRSNSRIFSLAGLSPDKITLRSSGPSGAQEHEDEHEGDGVSAGDYGRLL